MQTTFNFASLDISRTYDLKIGDLNIPLLIHIKDIRENEGSPKVFEEEVIKYVDDDGRHMEIHSNESTVYDVIRNHIKLKESFRNYARFIDVNIPLFNGGRECFLEYYELDSLDDLLEILSESDMQKLINKCDEIVVAIMEEFFINIKAFLTNGTSVPVIRLKASKFDADMDAISKYSDKPSGYLIAQIGVEFAMNIFFEENIGKAISQWSLRELQLQALYITEKNIMEGLTDKWKAKQHEDMESKNKS